MRALIRALRVRVWVRGPVIALDGAQIGALVLLLLLLLALLRFSLLRAVVLASL
jgi:hypothetical protein